MLELSLNLSFLRLALVLVEHKLLAAGGLERLPYVKRLRVIDLYPYNTLA